MKPDQIKAGSLYLNKKNKYQYDKVLCVEHIQYNEKRVMDGYIQYYWVRKPNITQYASIDTALDWELIDESI